ncbi:LysR family transcriptional regulator [Rhizobium leguminosarum]|uniref:LysR family transcriptional regulator n=1 Tax=Rhizobium leguminosarum TaxID=384 RepID=UPI001C8FECE3|nr:LysR substrate-binding domain-containing protein [Rhizobium leguminosarum]MBY2915370.1 LysR family transcriptional regulator [Rhizobium leguminosarum]MBY2970908.1 LysR family transcriptional regulator [Rhizobium leguminosarum]MBY2977975.1 LysR family transcriptional regulator [Rhizobium leguminosarum]MBY3006525.1 LysR family transcriptional regulator [Rhizobium leguminosarum]
MNARQLEVFRAIMRDGSLTAAANSLAVSQPAVSKVLHHLEGQLGYKLFERIGGRLTATAEAHLLYSDADRVFREIEVLKDLARTIGERKVGLLRIGASMPVTFSVLPKALAAFQQGHPTVKIQLHALPKREIAEQLLIGDIDLGLTLSTIQAPTVKSEILASVGIVAVMLKSDPLAQKAEITAADVIGRPLISYGSNASDVGVPMDEAFEIAGGARQINVQISSSIAAAPLVQQGLGIALVDGLVEWSQFDGLVAIPFVPALMMNFAISTNSARPISRFYRPFLKNLRDTVKVG